MLRYGEIYIVQVYLGHEPYSQLIVLINEDFYLSYVHPTNYKQHIHIFEERKNNTVMGFSTSTNRYASIL